MQTKIKQQISILMVYYINTNFTFLLILIKLEESLKVQLKLSIHYFSNMKIALIHYLNKYERFSSRWYNQRNDECSVIYILFFTLNDSQVFSSSKLYRLNSLPLKKSGKHHDKFQIVKY